MRCNNNESRIKNLLTHTEKVDYLFKKIGSIVYEDRKWCDDRICVWYGCPMDVV